MDVQELGLPGVILIQPPRYRDSRGYFEELYRTDRYQQAGIPDTFVQDNLSQSQAGVVRGMHFQREPHGQGKLVRVLAGRVRDIIVDVRPDSPTYGQHLAVELSAEGGQMLFVPVGLAHGFEALEDTLFLYKCTSLYHKAAEAGIRYDDPALGIHWQTAQPIVSDKDLELPTLEQARAAGLLVPLA